MNLKRLGKTGLKVSELCLGTMTYGDPKWRDWVLPEEESRPFIRRALELGINFFDTADMYSLGVSEMVVGRALRDYAKRDEIVIATKVFNRMSDSPLSGGLSRKHILHAIDDSLRRLGTDYIDLYQIHRWDYDTPIEETLEALNDVVRAGKARYIGASSMFAWQFMKALSISEKNGWAKFVSMQNVYNLVYREEEREMLPLCADQGIGVIPWSPLARGFLAGNRKKGEDGATTRSRSDAMIKSMKIGQDADYDVLSVVQDIAKERGFSPAQIALAWVCHSPHVTAPIVGASKMSHLEEAVAALDISLEMDDLARLNEAYVPHAVAGHR
ncbi:MAG: aldo/keto reductase [Sneathiella sp.]|jgi:aryl-alcohol dehydrogenase-like predicted oxidoreductase|uniref:aldo/keto reductase n=1 Tax=Sneathiella sp. TaxID=1964365 RepID=UPI000C612046|nr:aldo/keto reductase [Sneathiella sp.]MAL78091.1 aldo/keto reductase [Sneathiella sp.]|tara:strand:- start:651 stop:1634 length:984 start_codon:yes stop_codon:yes gene_type:complete